MKKRKSQSILNERIMLDDIAFESFEEGKDYINIAKYSETEVGRKLSPGYPINIQTVFGRVGNLRAALDYVTTPGYPEDLLRAKKLDAKDVKRIPKNKKNIPNYSAMITYLLATRIKSDEELIKALKELPDGIKLTSVSTKEAESFGIPFKVYKKNGKMGRYVAAISFIVDLIKEDKFTDENITELIKKSKDDPELSVFDGLPMKVDIDL